MLLLIDLKGGENTKSKRLFIISIILVFFIEFSLKQIYTKFISKSANMARKIVEASEKGDYSNIAFFSIFTS